ncbi:hypothetical protein BU15DRAFT_63929 [Melanogaster broomeanus]|nr:hypothetical protein BU15DRAFT_63929 [Melanogaster broomeanus]
MSLPLGASTSNLCYEIRHVRNIEIHYSDLLPLIEGSRKLPSSTVNAFGAIIQGQNITRDGSQTSDVLVLSSWIPTLATGSISATYTNGTIEDHLAAASNHIPIFSTEGPRWPCWMLPLCGGSPSHWVLGLVNFTTSTYGIYDSIPELNSKTWAKPLLQQTIGAVKIINSQPEEDWEKWTFTVHAPPPMERQHDSWSCGLFVMMAMSAFKQNMSFDSAGDTYKNDTRKRALQMILELPYVTMSLLRTYANQLTLGLQGSLVLFLPWKNTSDDDVIIVDEPQTAPLKRRHDQSISTMSMVKGIDSPGELRTKRKL